MNTRPARYLATLTVAASVALLAGCFEPTRQAVQPPAVTPAVAPPAREPAASVRPNPATANVSAPVAELARLHQSGLDESVVKAFVEKSTNTLAPSADELIFLKDVGVSPRVITALIQQTARMRELTTAPVPATLPPPAPTPPAETRPTMTVIAANATPPAPAPAPAAPAAAAPATAEIGRAHV